MTGIELIAKERQEQIEKHGRTVELDRKQNGLNQLLKAARVLTNENVSSLLADVTKPVGWDMAIWQKMMDKPYRERLVIAGALIAAEIDRMGE